MTLPRLDAMMKHWDTSPPLNRAINEMRLMMRGYFGIKDKQQNKTDKGSDNSGNLGDLIGDFSAAGFEIKKEGVILA